MATMKNVMIYPWGVLSTLIILLASIIEGNIGKNSKSDIFTNLNYLKHEKNLQKINNPNLSRFLEEIGVNQHEKENIKMKDYEIGENHAKILEILDDKKKLESIKANLSQARTALKEVKDFHKEWRGKVNIDGDGGKARDLSIKLEDMSNSVIELVNKYNYNKDKTPRKLKIKFNDINLSLNQDAIKENTIALLNEINLNDINIGKDNSQNRIYKRDYDVLAIVLSSDFDNIEKCNDISITHRGHIIPVNNIKDYLLNKLKKTNLDKTVFAQSFSEYMMLFDSENYLFNYDKEMKEKKEKIESYNRLFDEMSIKMTKLTDLKEGKSKSQNIDIFLFMDTKLNNYFRTDELKTAITNIESMAKDNVITIEDNKEPEEDLKNNLVLVLIEIKRFINNNKKKEIDLFINKYSCIIKFLTTKNLFDNDSENKCNEILSKSDIFTSIITFTFWNPGNVLIAPNDKQRLGEVYPLENIDGRVLIALKDENFNELKKIIFGLKIENNLQIENIKIREIDVEIKNINDKIKIEKEKAEKDQTIDELTVNLNKLEKIKLIIDPIKGRRDQLIQDLKTQNQDLLEISAFFKIWNIIFTQSKFSYLNENNLLGNTEEEGNTETFWVKFSDKCDLNYLVEDQN